MPYKVCPACKQNSYSACLSGIWLCPYCGKELTLSKSLYDRRRILPQPAAPPLGNSANPGSLHYLSHQR